MEWFNNQFTILKLQRIRKYTSKYRFQLLLVQYLVDEETVRVTRYDARILCCCQFIDQLSEAWCHLG